MQKVKSAKKLLISKYRKKPGALCAGSKGRQAQGEHRLNTVGHRCKALWSRLKLTMAVSENLTAEGKIETPK